MKSAIDFTDQSLARVRLDFEDETLGMLERRLGKRRDQCPFSDPRRAAMWIKGYDLKRVCEGAE